MKKLGFLLLISVVMIFSGSVQAAFFQGLGYLPGGRFVSMAEGISDDGLIVVGSSDSESMTFGEAFRWTQAEGMVGLGCLPGYEHSVAYGVSNDGETVAGAVTISDWSQAFRWTESGGMVGLGYLSRCQSSTARGISGDGSVVVGKGETPGNDECDMSGPSAFHWTESSGMVDLGSLMGAIVSSAYGISNDGSVVVGNFRSESYSGPFRWTESGGVVGLGDLPGLVRGVSSDGSVVIGAIRSELGYEAFRWTESSGMVGLGDLPGGRFYSRASGVSGDGSVVVGTSGTRSTGRQEEDAFIWDEAYGMRRLEDVLTNCGVDLNGWQLVVATDVSADGKTIVGYGLNPDGNTEAWIANISKISIDAIINFFDESVADGTLTGYGPGKSANGRLNALRNMFEMVADLIAIGDIEGACGQLKATLKKCDGINKPPDFVAGPAASELYDMILELMEELGCE